MNPVVRLSALTNTQNVESAPPTNNLQYADLKLDRGIIYYDDPTTYTTLKSLTLNDKPISPHNFNFTYEPVMWSNSASHNEKRIGTIKATLTPKYPNYKGKLDI